MDGRSQADRSIINHQGVEVFHLIFLEMIDYPVPQKQDQRHGNGSPGQQGKPVQIFDMVAKFKLVARQGIHIGITLTRQEGFFFMEMLLAFPDELNEQPLCVPRIIWCFVGINQVIQFCHQHLVLFINALVARAELVVPDNSIQKPANH